MRELEQRQKAKGKQRADLEEDPRISELPEQFHDAVKLARSVLAKDASGVHNPHSHRWSELLYKVRLHYVLLLYLMHPADRRAPHPRQHGRPNGQRRRNRSRSTLRPSLARPPRTHAARRGATNTTRADDALDVPPPAARRTVRLARRISRPRTRRSGASGERGQCRG
jgi:hypothetical protein